MKTMAKKKRRGGRTTRETKTRKRTEKGEKSKGEEDGKRIQETYPG